MQRALELGRIATGVNLWAEGQRTARVPIGEAGRELTPYPYILILGQDDNERILGDKLREHGGAVAWNTELVALDPHDDHVVATLKQPDGSSRTVRAAWVAGCDGAHSAVRKLNGIEFPGAPYEHVFFVADVEASGGMVPDEVNVYLWRSGFHLFFPMRGERHWRVVGIVPEPLRGRDDLRFDEVVPSIRGEAGASLTFGACRWFSSYRIHHRAAARFRAGRCFLLGDAAHIHSPVGAQGMNTGLQDAYNLAWKLALVVSEGADAALLDSYEAERIPVAQRLLATTDRAFRLIVSDHPLAGLLRTEVLARIAAFAMRRSVVQALAFRTVSQTAIAYRSSPLSHDEPGLSDDAPRAGDRFPWLRLQWRADGPVEDLFETLDDRHFHLLVFGARIESALPFERLIVPHVVAPTPRNDEALRRARIPQPSAWLLRPDGHVGLCGTRLDAAAIGRYVAERLTLVR